MERGLYQNMVNLSLAFTQRLGYQAYDCKMASISWGDAFYKPTGVVNQIVSIENCGK